MSDSADSCFRYLRLGDGQLMKRGDFERSVHDTNLFCLEIA